MKKREVLEVDPTQRIRPIIGGVSYAEKNVTAGTGTIVFTPMEVDEETYKVVTYPYEIPNVWERFIRWLKNLFGLKNDDTPDPPTPDPEDPPDIGTHIILVPCIISNAHVLSNENRAQIGSQILQPGPYDGGKLPNDKVGELYRDVELKTNMTNYVDVALATIDHTVAYELKVNGMGYYKTEYIMPKVGDKVFKWGRTTGYTEGQVTGVNGASRVQYDKGTLIFESLIVIDGYGFSDGGDSGSMIFTAKGHYPCALLFAGSSRVTLGCRMDLVDKAIGPIYFAPDVQQISLNTTRPKKKLRIS